MEKTVSVKFCVGHKDMFCEQRNFSLVCFLGGGTRTRKSVARDFYHRFTCDGHAVHLFDH